MLTDKQIDFLREELKTAKNPLFFHDGDGDGLGAFLLLYRIHREGKGYILNSSSRLSSQFLNKVEELNPDKIFILDIPLVDQEFIDGAKRPIFWIDHHPPLERKNVHYFNPRISDPDAYIPTTRMCYQISDNKDDLWIAAAGSLADYWMPDFIDEVIEKYPQLVPKKEKLGDIIFKSPIIKLIKLFFFIQKGPTYDIRKSIKIMTRIESPEEIFNEETPQGKFILKRFNKINFKYEELLKEAKSKVTRSKLLLFYYSENKWSFTANLANELSVLYPKKVILITRNKSGEMKCSLRGKNVIKSLQNALVGINGHGGGHPDACGAVVKEEDWEQFLENFKTEIKNV